MIHTWTIEETNSGDRLDVFLASKLEGMTRSAVAKHLKRGAGTVNGSPASVHRFLKTGDQVAFNDAEEKTTEVEDAPLPELRIVEETNDWIVLDKPPGVIVHPDTVTKRGTLADALVAHVPSIAKIGEDPSRPGIVHRLDKDVRGLMVVAKTQSAFDELKRQFAEREIDKMYQALVHGDVAKDEDDIRFRIARSTSKARMAARPEHEDEGKAAWTHYRVIKRMHGATLLELKIMSGRTHQIRAHLLAIGHPVIGDPLYTLKHPSRKIRSPRILLQAVGLSFKDPATGERKHFSIPIDPLFADVMSTFKPHAEKTSS